MNQVRIEGMQARACGRTRLSNPHTCGGDRHREWQAGWETMDQQIGHVLTSAERMLEALEQLRRGRGILGTISEVSVPRAAR